MITVYHNLLTICNIEGRIAHAESVCIIHGILSGSITHYINDVNQNTLKNSRNRIDGALVNFINQTRSTGNIVVNEETVYEEEVPWNAGFGTSIFVFGFMLAGMFFGALSIICEYDNQTTIFGMIFSCWIGAQER